MPNSNLKKVLFVLHFPPPVHGSSVMGKYVKSSEVINTAFSCRYINLGTSLTVDEIGRRPISKILRYFRIIGRVVKEIIVDKPHLVYFAISAKGVPFYKDAFVVMLIKLFCIPCVFHFHNKGVIQRQDLFIDNIIYKRVFSRSFAIVLSDLLSYDVAKYLKPKQIFICHNGIPALKDFSERNVNLQEDNELCRILFLSNLIESKGVFVLLEACSILKSLGVSFQCNFVGGEGDVSSKDLRHKVEELRLEECVNVKGPKYRAEKTEELLSADIFVFPSYNDCFPLVILEAMQAGLPVISTDEGAISDIVIDGETGFIVERKDAEDLAAKIKTLIEDEELRMRMSIAAEDRFKRHYTKEIFEQRMYEILNDILKTV